MLSAIDDGDPESELLIIFLGPEAPLVSFGKPVSGRLSPPTLA